jgi:hypothetical protein
MNAMMKKAMFTTLAAATLSVVAVPASAQYYYQPDTRYLEWRDTVEREEYLRSRREADRVLAQREREARATRRFERERWDPVVAERRALVYGAPVFNGPITHAEAAAAGLAPLSH